MQAPAQNVLQDRRNERRLAPGFERLERELAHEEGVPVRARRDRGDPLLGDAGAAEVLHQCGDLARRETPELDPLEAAHPAQRLECFAEGVAVDHLGLAQRGDQQHPRLRHLASQELEQAERGRVGPLEIVEKQEQRAVGRGGSEKVGDRVEEAKARALRRALEGGHQPGDAHPELRDQADQRRGGNTQRTAQRLVADGVDETAQDAEPRPVGLCAGLGRAPSRQHQRRVARGGRAPDQLLGRPRLADPRLAGQQHDPATAPRHLLERFAEPRQHLGAPYEVAALQASPPRTRASPRRTFLSQARRSGSRGHGACG